MICNPVELKKNKLSSIKSINKKFCFKTAAPELIEKLILQWDNNTSSDTLDIPVSALKSSARVLSKPFSEYI